MREAATEPPDLFDMRMMITSFAQSSPLPRIELRNVQAAQCGRELLLIRRRAGGIVRRRVGYRPLSEIDYNPIRTTHSGVGDIEVEIKPLDVPPSSPQSDH